MKTIRYLSVLFIFSAFNLSGQSGDWGKMLSKKDVTLQEVQENFYKSWEGKKPKKGQGYNVFKRWEARMISKTYPSGLISIPDQAFTNYNEWQRSNRVSLRSPNGNWVEIGPTSKPTGYDSGVGRIDFVTYHPTETNTMYVSTPDGGLWKTTNANDSFPNWTTVNDFLSVIGCGELVINPFDPNIMYLATGSWESDKKSIGVLKSTNGGSTWTTTGLMFPLSDKYRMRRLIMDPTNPLILMAATDGGLFRSTDGGVNWNTPVTLNSSYDLNDLKFKPGDSDIVYASGTVSGGEVFWKSTDKGASWAAVTTNLPAASAISRIVMAVGSADPTYVYLIAGNTDGGYLGTYRSTDSGSSFTNMTPMMGKTNILNSNVPAPVDPMPSTPENGGQASHDLAIAMSPSNKDVITIGGISSYRSTDGGETWTLLTYWYGIDPAFPGDGSNAPYIHADIQGIFYKPGSPNTMHIVSDGGVYRSIDDGASWIDQSNNIRVGQQTDVSVSTDNTVIVAGQQDIGNVKNTDGTYTYIGGGDGESLFIDYNNKLNIVTSEPNGGHRFTSNGGMSKEVLDTGLPAGTLFYSQITQDPVVSTTCYAGGRDSIWKSIDYQSAPNHTWTDMGTMFGSGPVTTFAIAKSNTDVIYGARTGALSKTTDGGMSWTNVTGTLPMATAYLSKIAISNTDPNKVWVVFGSYSVGNKVFRTTDGGGTWTNISSTLPNIEFKSLVYRNGSNDEVYIGAEIGVYVTNNTISSGTAWVAFHTGLPNTVVNDLEIHYGSNTILAGTYGRGSWKSNLYTGPSQVLVSAKAFLQGNYAGGGKMSDNLRTKNLIPAGDPYPGLGFTHVSGQIEGSNSAVFANPDANNAIVDWIRMELRDASNAATILHTRSVLIQRDGDIVDLDGSSPVQFPNAASGNYFVVLKHRNHLGIRTLSAIALSGSTTNLNFTDGSTAVYGLNPQPTLSAGVFGLYAGDANGDGQVNSSDYLLNWRPENSQLGYKKSDFNLDGQVNSSDQLLYWRLNNSKIEQLKP